MGGPIDEIRKRISRETTTPLTTVPIYQTVVERGSFKAMTEHDLTQMIKKHVGEGISSIVIHAGFTFEMLDELRGLRRIMGLISKRRLIHGCLDVAERQREPVPIPV